MEQKILERFILQSIICFKERRVFNSWLNNKPPSYIHRGSNATLYLFQINAKIMETFTGGVDYFYKVFSKRKLLTSKNIKINQEI